MNTEDFKPIPDLSWPEIFEKQKQIKFLYEPESLEMFRNFDIDTDQEIFKKYCWRITEELMEALEDQNNENHFREELIDGMNFLIELYLLYGWDFEEVNIRFKFEFIDPSQQILKIIYQLGITANLLKNRQWRKSQYLVDLYIFEPRFQKIWVEYLKLFFVVGVKEPGIRSLWSLKYQVNLFRINTNY